MPPVAGKVSSAECTTLPVGSTRELRERDVLGLIPSTMAQRSRNTDRAAIESPSMNTHQVHGPVEQSKSVLLAAIRRRIISRYVNDIPFQRHFGKTELAMSAPSTSPSGRLRRATRSPGNSPAERKQINEANKKYWRDARTLSLENGEFDTIGYGALVNV